MNIQLPTKMVRGGQSKAAIESYLHSLQVFANDMKTVQDTLDFNMSARGWCYVLEPYGLNKSDFDWAGDQINAARLKGFLRPGFILEEAGHEVDEAFDDDVLPDEYVNDGYEAYQEAEVTFRSSWAVYDEVSFWEDKDYYLQLLVEKSDLKSLFQKVCNKYHISIANSRGWGSIEQRAVMAKKFKEMEEQGKQPILLVCGDFDPPGLCISDVLKKRFEESILFSGWDPVNLEVDRIGLSYDFIQENGLSWIKGLGTGAKTGIKDMADPRHVCWERNTYHVREYVRDYGKRKCEANAVVIVPELGRQILVDAIEKYVGQDAWVNYENEIVKRREVIREFIEDKLES